MMQRRNSALANNRDSVSSTASTPKLTTNSSYDSAKNSPGGIGKKPK